MLGKRKEGGVSSQEVRNVIGIDCVFEGNLTIPESITRIDGEVVGNIKGNGSLIIGERGLVRGDVNVESVVVYGKVQGNIKARSLEIRASGKVEGDIQVEELIVEKGAVYNGKCSMGKESLEVG